MSATILSFPRRVTPQVAQDQVAQSASLGVAVADAAQPPPPTAPEAKRSRALTPVPLARPRRALTAAEECLQERMLQAFFEGHRLAKNHALKGIQRDRDHVRQFLEYVGQPLWAMTEGDFESWAAHLVLDRHLAASSQRVAQGAVATCFDFLVRNRGWQNEAHQQFGGRLVMVVTPENRVTHTSDKARARQHKFFTAEQLTQVFILFDDVIAACAESCHRQLRLVQRDKAMFYTFYAYALRLAEGRGLNLSSFSANTDIPELGDFGFVGVFGKGSKGSGPRYRSVPAIDPDIKDVLTWYIKDVRPQFRQVTSDARDAMWLSERGTRMSGKSIWQRFKLFLSAIGIDHRQFSTHGLRHMALSHSGEAGLPLGFTQDRAGHEFAATTQLYTHLSDEFSRNIAVNVVLGSLDRWKDT